MINKGKIVDGIYIKAVDFSRAVLWKNRQLSLPTEIFEEIKNQNVKQMQFIGKGRIKEKWVFDVAEVDLNKIKKTEGQEKQYYFDIKLDKSDSKITKGMKK